MKGYINFTANKYENNVTLMLKKIVPKIYLTKKTFISFLQIIIG